MSTFMKLVAIVLGLAAVNAIVQIAVGFYEQNAHQVNVVLGVLATTLIAGSIFYLNQKLKKEQALLNAIIWDIRILSGDKENSAGEILPGFSWDNFHEKRNELGFRLITELARQKVAEHQKVLRRKKAQLTYRDEYGCAITGRWEKELWHFVRNVLLPIDTDEVTPSSQGVLADLREKHCIDTKENVSYWMEWVDSNIDADSDRHTLFREGMSGHDYEHFVAERIREHGWSAEVTKGSGDHGADIIVENDEHRIVVQCKLYSSNVSNKSVQEAFSAKSYYDCDHACVVSNASFTPAAKQAASKLDVRLLHHDDLDEYLAELGQ